MYILLELKSSKRLFLALKIIFDFDLVNLIIFFARSIILMLFFEARITVLFFDFMPRAETDPSPMSSTCR